MSDFLSAAEVAALRIAMGLSQVQFGAMLGVNPRTVRSWESGRDHTSPGSTAAIWSLVARHEALVAQYRDSEDVVGVVRDRSATEIPPRGWYLAAAGRAMVTDPDLMVDWV